MGSIEIPSVTTVIRFVNSQAFADVPPERLAIAQERGKEFHRLAALYAKKLWIDEVPEICAGYFNSFTRWYDRNVVKAVLVEKTLVHPVLGYKGTPDIIVEMRGDKVLTLPDYKTPQVFSKSWRLQLAAYWELAVKNGYLVERVGALKPHPKGKTAKFEEYTGTLAADFNRFWAALIVWQFFN